LFSLRGVFNLGFLAKKNVIFFLFSLHDQTCHPPSYIQLVVNFSPAALPEAIWWQ